jgi:hypothetical protein
MFCTSLDTDTLNPCDCLKSAFSVQIWVWSETYEYELVNVPFVECSRHSTRAQRELDIPLPSASCLGIAHLIHRGQPHDILSDTTYGLTISIAGPNRTLCTIRLISPGIQRRYVDSDHSLSTFSSELLGHCLSSGPHQPPTKRGGNINTGRESGYILCQTKSSRTIVEAEGGYVQSRYSRRVSNAATYTKTLCEVRSEER